MPNVAWQIREFHGFTCFLKLLNVTFGNDIYVNMSNELTQLKLIQVLSTVADSS